MTKRFRVTLRQDAWINHFAEIEAGTAEEAALLAERAWKTGEPNLTFTEDDVTGFDAIMVDPEECEEIDENGEPVS
jgi:hypothetical protein